jgi:hypothetical protein
MKEATMITKDCGKSRLQESSHQETRDYGNGNCDHRSPIFAAHRIKANTKATRGSALSFINHAMSIILFN